MKKIFDKINKKRKNDVSISKDSVPSPPRDTADINPQITEPLADLEISNETPLIDFENKVVNHRGVVIEDVSENSTEEKSKHKSIAQKLKYKQKKKTKDNVVNYNISNSSDFHIGQSINIDVSNSSGVSIVNGVPQSSNSTIVKDSLKPHTKWKQLMDMDDRLESEDILVIAQNMNEEWKEFGLSLGIPETRLQELERENHSNREDIVYQMMREFTDTYPGTSIGFIAYKLEYCQQAGALDGLVQHKLC